MKIKPLLAAALALTISCKIFAQQTDNATPPPGKTRAQVMEELKQAQESGDDMPTGFIAFHAPKIRQPATPSKTASKN